MTGDFISCEFSIHFLNYFMHFNIDLPSGTVLSSTVKLAENPSFAIALSVLIVKAKIPVQDMIRPGVFCPQYLPMYGPTAERDKDRGKRGMIRQV